MARTSGADADEQVAAPDKRNEELRGQLGGAAHVLGFLGQGVSFRRDAVHHVFDGAVAQFHHDGKRQRQYEQDALRPGAAEQHSQDESRPAQTDDLTEGLFVLPGGAVAVQRITQGVAQADKAGTALEVIAEWGGGFGHGHT